MSDVDCAPTPTLYLVQRDDVGTIRESIFHVWHDDWIVPMNDIRRICAELNLDLDIFNTPH